MFKYAAPQVDEIAVFMPNSTQHMTQPFCSYRDIQLRDFTGENQSINEMNGMYDPLHYPLMFPYGDLGYSYLDKKNYIARKQLTPQDYYQQMLQIRPAKPFYLYSRLFKEYLCDQFAKIEGWRLNYIRSNQKTLKAEAYSGIVDFLHVGIGVNKKQKNEASNKNKNTSNTTGSHIQDDIKLGKTHVVLGLFREGQGGIIQKF